jgi:hypothetical protein
LEVIQSLLSLLMMPSDPEGAVPEEKERKNLGEKNVSAAMA